MNILDGARLANRSAALSAMGRTMATSVAVGAAAQVLSIKAAIEGKQQIQQEEALRSVIAEIRRVALKIHRRHERLDVKLSESEVEALSALKTGAKTLVMRGLSTVGSWFIKTMLRGVTSVVVPAFRLLATAAGFVFRVVFTNPYVLGLLAASAAAYMLYRKFSNKAEEPIKMDNMLQPEPVRPTDGSSSKEAPRKEKQSMPQAEMKRQPTPTESFTPRSVPAASTATAAPTEVLDSKGRKRDKIPFGLLNNNPGNVEFRNQEGAKLYQPNPNKKGRFAIFPTQEEGLYQIGRQLQLYDSRGDNTIRKMINKYAPSTENNTAGYIDGIVKQSGYDADKQVDMTDVKLVSALIRGIVRAEVGTAPYTDKQYEEAALRSIAFRGNKYNDTALGMQIPTYGRLSSTYGTRVDPVSGSFERKHKGIDIAAPKGTPVYAATEGKASVKAGTKGGYGNLLDILGKDYNTRYAHLDGFDVDDGDIVKAGQQVARVGNTGRSTGNHLHFEVRDKKNNDINPATVMALPPKGQIEKQKVVPLPSNHELAVIRRNGQLLRLEK